VQLSLRHIVFFKVVKELLGSGGKLKLLRCALVFLPDIEDFFL
jgi:hypothetical protein